MITSLIALAALTLGVYAGKGRARNKTWRTISREILSGAWALVSGVYLWMSGLFRRERHYIEAEVSDKGD